MNTSYGILLTCLLVCINSLNSFGQNETRKFNAVGLKISSINHFYEEYQNPISPSIGIFGQFHLNPNYALETSLSYAQHFYQFQKRNLRITFPVSIYLIQLRERSLSFKVLNKIYLSHQKVSSYFAVGGMVHFPTSGKGYQNNLTFEVTNDLMIHKKDLNKTYAVTLGFGFDYFATENLFLATQFGLNYFTDASFSSYLNKSFSPETSNQDVQNIYVDVSIGYIIK